MSRHAIGVDVPHKKYTISGSSRFNCSRPAKRKELLAATPSSFAGLLLRAALWQARAARRARELPARELRTAWELREAT